MSTDTPEDSEAFKKFMELQKVSVDMLEDDNVDELECFIKAAELGCPDFFVSEHGSVWLRQAEWISGYMMDEAQKYLLPCLDSKRINRYAASVCAELWIDQTEENFKQGEIARMVRQARAFGKKYGGE